MGILHLVQGIMMIVPSNDTTYPIYTNFLKFNAETFALLPSSELLVILGYLVYTLYSVFAVS